jgi:hypothetical protein
MGSFLVKLLTDPGDFQFYAGNSEGQLGSVSNPTSFGQKSIPFGKDRPGGGSSNQPYIKKPVQEEFKNPAFYSDFLIRGGILAPLSAAEDATRLTKYFTDINNPSGILFATKQNILSRVGVKTEAVRPSPAYLGGALNEGVYLPTSTVAQALVGFTGTTLNKQGIDPTGLIPFLSIDKYQETVYKKNQFQVIGTSIPKSVQRKVDKINQNIIKTNNSLIQTQKNLASQTTYSPSQPTSLDFSALGNSRINRVNNRFNNREQQQFESDVEWDQVKENRLKKRVSNLEDELGGLQDQLSNTLQNRLLKLWNKFGLNSSNESQVSNSSTLLSYGGGPGSALGFSRTKIKFATSNDGETPLRTGYVMVDPYAGIGYLNYSPGNPIVYGLDPIFDGKQLYSSVYRQYQKKNPSVTEEQYFGVPTYFNDVLAGGYDGALTIQPWDVKPSNNSTLSEQQLAAQELNLNSDTLEDFRTLLIPLTKENSTFLSPTSNYPQDFEKRFNLTGGTGISAGNRRRNRSNPSSGSLVNDSSVSQPLDSVTAYPIYKSEFKNGSRYGKEGFEELNDIVEFSIAILNNDDQNKPENGITGLSYRKYMHFRAFIDNVQDSYTAEWNGIKYMGRGEKFYKYGGFERQMSLGFTVVAQSKDELNIMYDKLNFLASSLAPEYLDSLTSGYMCGNIAYITLGDYIYDQPGIITSLTFDIPEDSPWEIKRDTKFVSGSAVSGTARQLPHMIKVTLNFTPIQKFRPSKQTWANEFTRKGEGIAESTLLVDPGNQRFIDPNNTFNAKNTSAGALQETRIELRSQIQINEIPNSPVSVDTVLGNQGEVFVP